MAFQETIDRFKNRYRGKVNQLFIIGMCLLLALRVLILMFDANLTLEPHEPQPTPIESKLKPGSPIQQSVHRLTQPLPEFGESDYLTLGKFNMFDPKKMQGPEKLEQAANAEYLEAATLESQG